MNRQRLQAVSKRLASQEKGTLNVEWDRAVNAPGGRTEVTVDAPMQERNGVDLRGERRLDIVSPNWEQRLDPGTLAQLRRQGYTDDQLATLVDKIEYGEVREVKGGRLAKTDLERLELYLKLATAKPPAIVDGMVVQRVVLVLNDPFALRDATVRAQVDQMEFDSVSRLVLDGPGAGP